jgi:integrase/recombinase XerD
MKQAKTLEGRELKALLTYVATRRHGDRDRAIVALSFYAGLRAQEIASLTVGSVRGADGKMLAETLLQPSQTKGKQGRRVFWSKRLQKELELYLKGIGSNLTMEDPLFRTQKGNQFTANAMAHLFRAIYAQVGIKGASSHSGRRTFITNLASKSISVRILATLAGHSSISTTQRYIDVNDNQLRAAVEML